MSAPVSHALSWRGWVIQALYFPLWMPSEKVATFKVLDLTRHRIDPASPTRISGCSTQCALLSQPGHVNLGEVLQGMSVYSHPRLYYFSGTMYVHNNEKVGFLSLTILKCYKFIYPTDWWLRRTEQYFTYSAAATIIVGGNRVGCDWISFIIFSLLIKGAYHHICEILTSYHKFNKWLFALCKYSQHCHWSCHDVNQL